MAKNYFELVLQLQPQQQEIWVALLVEEGFESFQQTENELFAYISEEESNIKNIEEIVKNISLPAENYKINHIAGQNWNEIWESNFKPVEVKNTIRVRAPHHEKFEAFPIDLLIQPKMSFGTGHHATTSLVLEFLLEVDLQDKSVLDFGCGTGILAIAAKKLGAKTVIAVDNDPQCIENSLENLQINDTEDIELFLGDISTINTKVFDIIVANITRNVLISFAENIASNLNRNGILIASGFYENDLEILKQVFFTFNLECIGSKTKDKWCAALFVKK